MAKKIKNKLKSVINKYKKNHNWKKKYNELLKEYDKVFLENMIKEKEIDNLNFKLEKDNQAQKIENLEYSNQRKLETIHRLRSEIIDLKEKRKKC